MGREDLVRISFVEWAAKQSPAAAVLLPELTIGGKKLDLLCVEEPFDTAELKGMGSRILASYGVDTWRNVLNPMVIENRRKLLTPEYRNVPGLMGQVAGNKTWLVELKVKLEDRALGQIHVYEHLISTKFPDVEISRRIIAYFQDDPVIAKVCAKFGIETITLTEEEPLIQHFRF